MSAISLSSAAILSGSASSSLCSLYESFFCRADGAYLWDSEANVLKQVTDKDLRGFTGRMGNPENFALVAPVALVYVIDYARQGMQQRPQDAFKYASVDCGFIGQNAMLNYCVLDKHVTVRGGKTLSGADSFPVYISRNIQI